MKVGDLIYCDRYDDLGIIISQGRAAQFGNVSSTWTNILWAGGITDWIYSHELRLLSTGLY